MDKNLFLLLGRIRKEDKPVILSGEDARMADELEARGLVVGNSVRAFGDTDFTFVCRSVTEKGIRALDNLNGNAQDMAVADTAENRPSWFRRNRDAIIVGILTSSIVAVLFKLLEPYVFGGK